MGLFNFLKKEEKITENANNQPEKQAYYGDLKKTALLNELFQVLPEQRDEKWQSSFFEHVADASFACGNPQLITGPDGFPYFQLDTPVANKPFQCFVIRNMIQDFLLEKGLGVVINPGKGQPDWVFSYGDMVNFHLHQAFYTNSSNPLLPEEEMIQEKEEVLVGQPSESFLPEPTRENLREFLIQNEFENTKILLMNRKKNETVYQELVFNLTPDKFENEEHYRWMMKSLAWYLPRHYSLVCVQENTFKTDFKNL